MGFDFFWSRFQVPGEGCTFHFWLYWGYIGVIKGSYRDFIGFYRGHIRVQNGISASFRPPKASLSPVWTIDDLAEADFDWTIIDGQVLAFQLHSAYPASVRQFIEESSTDFGTIEKPWEL